MKLFSVCFLLSAAILISCTTITGKENQSGLSALQPQQNKNPYYSRTDITLLHVSDAEWKKILPDSIYQVARLKGTEYSFSGKYWNYTGIGTYYCVVCGNALFKSDAKFSSSCGWPSFYETIRPGSVIYQDDYSHHMVRTEVICGRCGSHLGHIFDDGPPPTGKRFCMNSIMLDFEPDSVPGK